MTMMFCEAKALRQIIYQAHMSILLLYLLVISFHVYLVFAWLKQGLFTFTVHRLFTCKSLDPS